MIKYLIAILLLPVTIFSQTIPLDTIVTPVDFLYFNVDCNHIEWSTASETNNDFFTIDYSKNNKNWTEIIEEPGAGNSNEKISYIIEVENQSGYYRLMQTDFDGTTEYLEIKYLNCTDNENKPIYINLFGSRILDMKNYSGFYLEIYGKKVIKKHKMSF